MTGLAISPTQNHHVIVLVSLAKQVETGESAVTSSSDFRRPTNLGPGVEALRAKWGWIVALGTIYVLVGLIALYSVVMATVASVFVVGIMMLIAGVAEVINAFQVKSWGKFFLWTSSRRVVHPCRPRHVREPAPRRSALDPCARGDARRLRHHADHTGLQYEGGDTMDRGGFLRCGHVPAWPHHPGALASIKPLHSRTFPRH